MARGRKKFTPKDPSLCQVENCNNKATYYVEIKLGGVKVSKVIMCNIHEQELNTASKGKVTPIKEPK